MDELEAFLLAEVATHPQDLADHALRSLRTERSAVDGAIQSLVDRQILERSSAVGLRWKPALRTRVTPDLEEDRLWRETIAPRLAHAPVEVRALLEYGCTEMLNNVIDHSGAAELVVLVKPLPEEAEVHVEDNGVGIFEKLESERGLTSPRHVALELSKGKLTTDPSRHTGEGVFFTSRMCDKFLIWSGSTVCGHVGDGVWHVRDAEPRMGTTVRMSVLLSTTRTTKQVFDEFAPPRHGFRFWKTSLQVGLLRESSEELVSRSQAKRLMARCDQFSEVVLDFQGVAAIGPAFADEIFRVFANRNPDVVLGIENATDDVRSMISRARSASSEPGQP